MLSKRIDRMIDEFNNLQMENRRDREGEKVHKDLFRKFLNGPCYGYVRPQLNSNWDHEVNLTLQKYVYNRDVAIQSYTP